MGLRPTTKKVNGRWYDINQAADRIAELEQQVEALKEAAVATCEGHRQKVTQGDLSYYQYPSEQMERLATLATAQQEGE